MNAGSEFGKTVHAFMRAICFICRDMPDTMRARAHRLWMCVRRAMLRDIVAPPLAKSASMNSFTHESLKIVLALYIQVGVVFIWCSSVIRFVPRFQLVITIPSKTAMAATAKAKAARAARQKQKEQAIRRNAESKRQHHLAQAAKRQAESDAISSAVRNDWMQIPLETKTKHGYKVRNAQVCFYYGEKLCAKTPDTLNMIARLLAAGVVESGADQVTVNHSTIGAQQIRESTNARAQTPPIKTT